jgi:hypothetical protein
MLEQPLGQFPRRLSLESRESDVVTVESDQDSHDEVEEEDEDVQVGTVDDEDVDEGDEGDEGEHKVGVGGGVRVPELKIKTRSNEL